MEEVSRLIESIGSKAASRLAELKDLQGEHEQVLEKLQTMQRELKGAQETIEQLRVQLERSESERNTSPQGLTSDQIRMLVKEIDECINLLSK